ncbi:MAG: protein kinase [Planctomycetota bacterium]
MLASGTKIGGFMIGNLLGKGAMGEVYRGEQLSLKRPVAIKRIATHLLENEDMVKRFKREAQVLAKVSHPNVVGVIECEEFPGPDGALHLLLIMELIEGGRSLKSHVGKPIDWRLATAVIRMCADGLAAAYDQQVVHRDIKPDNIMMTRKGIAKLVDFGLAKAAESTALTMQSAPMGTPLFMSPEACRGEEISHAGDLYSLGITWFYMLSGRYPFQAANLHGLLYKHINDPLPNPMGLFDNVPESIVKLCYQCLEKDAAKRPASAQKLVEAIESLPAQGLLLPRDARELLGAGSDSGHPSGGTTAGTLVAGPATVDRTAATMVSGGQAQQGATVGADLSPKGAAAATVMANLSGTTAAQEATRPTGLPPSATANTIIAPSTAAANAATIVAAAPAPAKSKAPLIIAGVIVAALVAAGAVLLPGGGKTTSPPTDTPAPHSTPSAAISTSPSPKPILTAPPTQQTAPTPGQTDPLPTETTTKTPADTTAADQAKAAEVKAAADKAAADKVAAQQAAADKAAQEAKRVAEGIKAFNAALAAKRWKEAKAASNALPEPARTETAGNLTQAANLQLAEAAKTARVQSDDDLNAAALTLHGAIGAQPYADQQFSAAYMSIVNAVSEARKKAQP